MEAVHGTYVSYRFHQCRCSDCKEWKKADNKRTKDLSNSRETNHGTKTAYRYGCRCDPCRRAKRGENSISNPRRYDPEWDPPPPRVLQGVSEYHLLRKYNLSLDDYNQMLSAQNGKCSICGLKPEKKLVVDHCHESGKVRALLCGHCNCALGFARDNPGVLREMAEYVEKHR